jgi:hypothetical protein
MSPPVVLGEGPMSPKRRANASAADMIKGERRWKRSKLDEGRLTGALLRVVGCMISKSES